MNEADEENGTKRQVAMLKDAGPRKTLVTKIGELQVELWEHPKGDAEPYACLIAHQVQITLTPMHASLLATAIGEWQALWESDMPSARGADLRLDVEGLSVQLYLSKGRRPPRGRFFLGGKGKRDKAIELSSIEVVVVASTLNSIVPDGENQTEP